MLMLDFSPHIWLCGLYVAHYSYTVGSNISTRHASEEANNYIHRIIKYRYQICGFLYFPDFREFVTALSIHRKGTFDERILWVFNLYDSDGNGRITKSELTDMVTVCIQCILLLCVESILVTLAVTGIPKTHVRPLHRIGASCTPGSKGLIWMAITDSTKSSS